MLDPETWDYLEDGASETACEDWDNARLRPRILRGVSAVDISTTLLGRPLRLPILTASDGRATRYWPDGELALLEGTETAGTIAVLASSVAANIGALRDLRPNARFWQQLYMMADRDRMCDLLQAVRQARCEAVVLTVDLLPDGRSVRPPQAAGWGRVRTGHRPQISSRRSRLTILPGCAAKPLCQCS